MLNKEAARVHSIQVSVDPDSGEVVGLSVSYDEPYTDAENPANNVTGMRTRDLLQPIRDAAVLAAQEAGGPDAAITVADVAARMRETMASDPAHNAAAVLAAALTVALNEGA